MGLIFVGIATVIVAAGVTWVATPGVIRLSGYLGAVDLPGGRKTHDEPMPRIGGLAVFVGFVAGLAFAAYITGYLSPLPKNTIYWQGLAIAATGLMLVGLIDDLWGLSFQWKFAAQILAAVYVWHSGFRIEVVTHPLGGTLDLGLFSFPLTVLWIVGITNAVNLIDGLDGLAAGVALIITSTVAVLALVRSELGLTAASVALAGALLGFLRYNFNPARIFLGDSGSLFLGFVLAVTSVRGSQKGPTAVAILAPLLVLGLPLIDTGLAVVRRVYRLQNRGRGRPGALGYVMRNCSEIFLPDRGHIHHRLLDLGMSHRGAVLALYGIATLFALAAFALVMFKSPLVAALLVAVLALTMATVFLLLYLRVWRPEQEAEPELAEEGSYEAPTGSVVSSKSQIQGR
jgi:UDP-GlcNAc:undecaprenyl-phosphate GlcNAc-1-phosphate transferase